MLGPHNFFEHPVEIFFIQEVSCPMDCTHCILKIPVRYPKTLLSQETLVISIQSTCSILLSVSCKFANVSKKSKFQKASNKVALGS
jgi:hypothetical protein